MPDKPVNPAPPPKDLTHNWIVAAMIRVDQATARAADFRGMFRTKTEQRVEALEVYCEQCKRPFEEADAPCQAKIDNRHLIGGDQRERMKRKPINLPPGAVVMPGPKINRRGIDAVIRGEL